MRLVKHLLLVGLFFSGTMASALTLHWSGDFHTEAHFIRNYSLSDNNLTLDQDRLEGHGYSIPGGGERTANFQTMFLRLRPTLVINDNLSIKSEWWLGDPRFNFLGAAFPDTRDQRQLNTTFSRGSQIHAQRFWGEILTDLGTLQVGRAPMDWGLGVLWSSGADPGSRYHSTGDMVRLISRFGAFTFSPSLIQYSSGENIGGSCPELVGSPESDGLEGPRVCDPSTGNARVLDFSLILSYLNYEEDLELGLNFIRRLAGGAQGPSGVLGFQGQPRGFQFNTWNIFGRKQLGPVSLAMEVPIVTGSIGASNYQTFAAAFEVDYQVTDRLSGALRAGHAPGQENVDPGETPEDFTAFHFHPDYNLGMLMFGYQFRNFVGPNNRNNPAVSAADLRSPFDQSVSNVNYASLSGAYQWNRWRFHSTWTVANAIETAEEGQDFYNVWTREFVTHNEGAGNQSAFMGWEMNYGATFFWDDHFSIDTTFGAFFPGAFYEFSNTPQSNETSTVLGVHVGATMRF
jgi:hypothetical protein